MGRCRRIRSSASVGVIRPEVLAVVLCAIEDMGMTDYRFVKYRVIL